MPTRPSDLFADEPPTKLTPKTERVTAPLDISTTPGRTRERHDTQPDFTDVDDGYGYERPEPVEIDVPDGFVKTLGINGHSATRQRGNNWWTLTNAEGFYDTTTDPAVVDVWCTERVLL